MDLRPATLMSNPSSITIATVLILVGLFLTAERVYLVNGATYPPILAEDLGNIDAKNLEYLHRTYCAEEPMEIYRKRDFWVVRCGFTYLQGRTFISHIDPMGIPSNNELTK